MHDRAIVAPTTQPLLASVNSTVKNSFVVPLVWGAAFGSDDPKKV
jgi:hypothetical protein